MTAAFSYDGRVVVMTGAAGGMGAATAHLLRSMGASVHAVDVADVVVPVERAHRCDLADPDAIDALVTALPAWVDVLVCCAGVAGGAQFDPLTVFSVNFLGLRHLTERLLDRIPSGGSVVHIASIAGNGWPAHVAELRELVDTPSFAGGRAWAAAHPDLLGSGYPFSKEAVQYYTQWRAAQTIKHGVRMNSVCPGVTDTKMMVDFRRSPGSWAIDMTAGAGIGRLARPDEIAPAVAFLGSVEASYVNGINLVVDGGFTAASATDQVDVDRYRPASG